MFRSLINDAKTAAGSLLDKYAMRASVAVPFLIALGFAIAGLTVVLIEQYGARDAYFLLAAGFAVVGLIASLMVQSKEQEVAEVKAEAEASGNAEVAADTVAAAAGAATELPFALIGALLSSPGTTQSLLNTARALGRNAPLVVLATVLGLLLWSEKRGALAPAMQRDETDASNAMPGSAAPNGAAQPFGIGDAA